jgi:hypothetical protein
MEKNGGTPATTPAMDTQMLDAWITEIARLAGIVEGTLVNAIANLGGEVASIREVVEANQGTLRAVNGSMGDLGTAIHLTLEQLPALGRAPQTERSTLGPRIQHSYREAAIVFAQLGGHFLTSREETEQRIAGLAETYHAIIAMMFLLLEEQFEQPDMPDAIGPAELGRRLLAVRSQETIITQQVCGVVQDREDVDQRIAALTESYTAVITVMRALARQLKVVT